MSSHASIGAERKIEHTGFQSPDPPLLLRYVDNENVALALTGVIKRDSFPSGDHLGEVLRPRDWVHCLTPRRFWEWG